MNTNIKSISIFGLGWLGFELGKSLLSRGWFVQGSTTTASKIPLLEKVGVKPHLLALEEDTCISASLAKRLLDTDLIFINLPPGRRDPNVEISFPAKVNSIIDAAEKLGEKKYLFISSTSVYGDAKGVVTEATDPSPSTASGRSLVKVEEMLKEQLGNRLTIIRPGGLVGGDRKAGRFFGGRKDIPNGNAPVNMIHRRDVIGIIEAIIDQDQFGKTFNIAADTHPSKAEFYTHQAQKQGFETPSFITTDLPREAFKIIANQKVKTDLAYTFEYPDVMRF